MQLNRKTLYNSTYKKLAVQFTADTYVVNQSLVIRMSICGENRQLLVAAKRMLYFNLVLENGTITILPFELDFTLFKFESTLAYKFGIR